MKKSPSLENVSFNEEKGIITIAGKGENGNDLVINDITESAFSGGPGGQNVNKSMKGVRLTCNVPEELVHTTKDRIQSLIVKAMDQKSKVQNRKQAYKELAKRIGKQFTTDAERKPTKITKETEESRMKERKNMQQKKANRHYITNRDTT